MVNKLNHESRISKIAHTIYWKIGVFLDTGCYDVEEVYSIFSEVSKVVYIEQTILFCRIF